MKIYCRFLKDKDDKFWNAVIRQSIVHGLIIKDIESYGAFIEVHVATSIEECEKRDRKGLYKLARAGKIKEFTGISDPYDVPEIVEINVNSMNKPYLDWLVDSTL